MAGEIEVKGPLRFVGYTQQPVPGTNGQFLRFNNGIATWANVPSSTSNINDIVTGASERDVLIDAKGDPITSTLSYVGVDTKPPKPEDGPDEFVKRTFIDGTTSVTFVDQDDNVTTFTPDPPSDTDTGLCVDGEVEIPGTTEATIPIAFDGNTTGGGGSSLPAGHNIQDNTGATLDERSTLQFEAPLNAEIDTTIGVNRILISSTAEKNTLADADPGHGVTLVAPQSGTELRIRPLDEGQHIGIFKEPDDEVVNIRVSSIPPFTDSSAGQSLEVNAANDAFEYVDYARGALEAYAQGYEEIPRTNTPSSFFTTLDNVVAINTQSNGPFIPYRVNSSQVASDTSRISFDSNDNVIAGQIGIYKIFSHSVIQLRSKANFTGTFTITISAATMPSGSSSHTNLYTIFSRNVTIGTATTNLGNYLIEAPYFAQHSAGATMGYSFIITAASAAFDLQDGLGNSQFDNGAVAYNEDHALIEKYNLPTT